MASASSDFLVDVTAPPGSLANSRTDFVAPAGTPYAAAYDQAHDLIFASNPDWNRVDVLSNTTHKLIKHIPPLSGEPYPSTLLNFTFPPGRPGRADLTVTSPIGSGTLSKSILYAEEVTNLSFGRCLQRDPAG